jgi:outer membrane receptor protein involved in Fe transport
MRKFGLLGTSALGSFTVIGLSIALATPAYAQEDAVDEDTPPCASMPEGTERDNCLAGEVETQSGTNANTTTASETTITVTGSRIRRPNLESTVPITSIGGESILQGGDTNVGETLNELPQLRSTFAQQNPGLGIGIAGLNLLDLRGLGTQRTLVLVNGRRHVPADILNNAVSVDVNTIPNDLIERVDIVTGGNSAIYGSDAIAGVVNFVLRRDFDGFQVRGNVSLPGAGFGASEYVSAMYGMNFGGGRGNITLHGEYAHQDRIFASNVPWYRQNNALGVVDADVAGLPGNSDNFPDRVFVRDIRSASIHYNGLVPINQQANNTTTPAFESGACGNGTLANNGGSNSLGTPYNCTYIFSQDGRLIQQTGARYNAGIIGSIAGGNGQTGREGNTVSILPFLERYNFNLLGHYQFSDAFEFFVEAKANRINALGNNAGPSFNQGTSGTGDFRERPRLDNPFLDPSDRATIANLILASNCRPDLLVGCPATTNIGTTAAPVLIQGNLTAADRAAIAAGTFRFVNSRNLLDVGLRDEAFQRDTFRIVGGLRGTFNDDWSYEVSANYGKFEEDITTDGFLDRQRFSLSMDAGRNPATGQIQCRSQFDPTAAVVLQPPAPSAAALATQNAARLAADIAACVPYNPFGQRDNSAAKAYFSRTFTAHSELEQLVLSGFVSGDTSSFFELPGGPVRFALGAEYRRENAFYQQDQFVTDGFTNGVSIPTFEPNTFVVKEAFGEIQIPILKDMPFFHELTASGAARVAKYQGAVGTVWSYNAGLDWAPVRDLRFRGNYSRAVRAPNVSETAFPLVPNFSPGFIDPCNPGQIGQGSSTRVTNCQTDLGAILPLLTDVTQSLAIVSGSSPNLTEETSDSWTLGAVFQPRFLPGFSLSIDYYDITVEGIIVSLTPQLIVNSCYDSANLNNVFCSQFDRNRTTSVNSTGDQPGRIVSNSLINAPLNFARRVRQGVDVNMGYRTNIGPNVKFSTNLIYTHNLKIGNFQDPVNPDFENRILGEVGDPEDEFRLDVDLTYKEFTLGYRMRYIGEQLISTYEDQNTLNGLPPANLDFADILEVPIVTYHDLRFEWNIDNAAGLADDLRFYFGVENIFDRHPPLGLLATGAGPGAVGNAGAYDIRGRTFFGGFRAKF